MQQPDEGARHRPIGLVVGRRAADKVKVFGVGLLLDGRDAQALRPIHALRSRQAVGVALGLDTPQRALRLFREFALLQHEAAAHVDDLRHVLDQHRAFLLARAAGDARPDLVLLDRLADQLLRLLGRAALLGRRVAHGLEEVLPSVDDDHLGIERLAGEEGRTLLLAATAFRAGVKVQEVLPGPLRDGADAIVLGVLQIDRRKRCAGFGRQLAEEHVGDGDDDVQVLRARDVDEEGEHRQDVDPVKDLVRRDRPGALPAEAFEGAGDDRGHRSP